MDDEDKRRKGSFKVDVRVDECIVDEIRGVVTVLSVWAKSGGMSGCGNRVLVIVIRS